MNISDFYKYSWFADLAYVEWDNTNGTGQNAIDAAIAAERAPQELAEKIFSETKENYSILSYYPNDDSGFKASLYGNGSEKILSICGTEPKTIEDWEADLSEIGGYGVAINQAVSMFNYIMRLTADTSQTDVLQLSWVMHHAMDGEPLPADETSYIIQGYDEFGGTDYYVLDASDTGQGLGVFLTEGDTITLTGHSLGGHLAAFAQRLFPELFDQTVTFNAPGFDPISSQGWTDEIVAMFGEYLSVSPAVSFASLSDRLFTIESEDTVLGDDFDLVSGDLTGTVPTEEIIVTTEKNSHSMSQMVDALGVQALLETLNPDLTLTETGALLQAASSDPGLSEEALINALSVLLLEGPSATPIINGEAPGDRFSPPSFDARTSLNQRLVELETAIDGQNLTIEVIATTDAEGNVTPLTPYDIESHARTDIAYRYALVNLNSFAVLGADYSEFNPNGELDIYNAVTGDGQLSNMYLADRAEMLANLIYCNIHDTTDAGGDGSPILYTDIRADDENLSISSGERQTLLDQARYTFGSQNPDNLFGTSNADHLYGGGGNDILNGQGDNDIIEGGKGRDTLNGGGGNDIFYIQGTDTAYDIFNGGEDIDTIQGSSGDDTIRVHELTPDNDIQLINGGGGEDIIAGTDMGDTINLSGTQLIDIDRIEGGGGLDTIIGSAGDDTIYGGSQEAVEDNGRDRLEGGSGNDIYHVGNGDIINDSDQQGTIWLNGQQLPSLTLAQSAENSDIYTTDDYMAQLDSDTGSLSVYDRNRVLSFTIENFTTGNYGITLQDYVAPQNNADITLTGTADHDEMSIINLGSDQTNWELAYTSFPEGVTSNTPFFNTLLPAVAPHLSVTGGDSGDFLFGFQSHDHIDGGDGSDVIMGYLGYWAGTELTMTGPLEGDLIEGGSGNDWIQGTGGDDQLFGGADNDIIQSYDGKDYLSGDTGNDVLAGGAHDAILEGGEGDDALFGDGYFTGSVNVTTDNVDSLGMAYTYAGAGYATGYTAVNYNIYNDAPNPGNDILGGGFGRDWLEGGAGNDLLDGGDNHDSLFGGNGNDVLQGGAGNDWLVGDNGDLTGSGNDTLSGGEGEDLLYGLGGDDVLHGGGGNDQLFGGEGADILNGGDENDYLCGGNGNDTLIGGRGTDTLEGGEGIDRYFLSDGDGTSWITDSGENIIEFTSVSSLADLSVSYVSITGGTAAPDQNGNSLWIEYGSGDLAIIENGRMNDSLQFTLGNGRSYSTAEIVDTVADNIQGTEGDDTIYAGGGDDTLYGNEGNDQLFGEDGNDILSGGEGNDCLSGGEGIDTAQYTKLLSDYDIYYVSNDLYVSSIGEGIDRLLGVDYLQFSDQTADLNAPLSVGGIGAETQEDTSLVLSEEDLLANSSAYAWDEVRVQSIDEAQGGSVAQDGNGNYVFTPEENFTGTADFSFWVVDARGRSIKSIAEINVNPIADIPLLEVGDAYGNEDEAISLDIQAILVDPDGSERLEVEISGVPEGAVLSAGIDNGDGRWMLTAGQLVGLTLIPPENSDEDFTLSITARSIETDGGIADVVAALAVTVNGVPDTPGLVVADTSGNINTAIALNIQASLVDQDGSESLTIKISGYLRGRLYRPERTTVTAAGR